MLFVPRQVALASSSHPPTAVAAMAKEEHKKEKKSKRKAAAAPDARAVVVASIAAFLEAGGFPRALAALQSEANLEVLQPLASLYRACGLCAVISARY
jgi:hypothetical protein